MRYRVFPMIMLVLALLGPGCSQDGIIAQGGGFSLTVEQLRFEITKLGPSSGYDDTYEGRRAVVMNLAARKFLADEAEWQGYGGEGLQQVVAAAEKGALADSYRRWKVDNTIMLPRIKTKPWIEKLDRRLHVKDLVFLVHPVAEEALSNLRTGSPLSAIEEAALEREDLRVTDLGWVIWKDLTREVANVVFRLGAGEASDIVAAGDGYHIFYVAEDTPFGLGVELLSVRSKRFVRAMEEERKQVELQNELRARYGVRFLEDGLSDGLKAFAVSFAGERPPDSLMAGVIAVYPEGQATVGDVFTLYFSQPAASRPYVGDYHSLSALAMDFLMPDLQARAGHEMHLDRDREVRFAVRTAREDFLVAVMEDYYRSQVEITPQDIEEYYEDRKEDLAEPARHRIRRIVVSSLQEASQARRRVLLGADFAEVAAQVSEDERSAPQGGDLGWLSVGMVAVYDSVLAGMEPGDVSAPFQTHTGVEILKLEERRPPRIPSLEESVPQIKMYITNTRANNMLSDFVTRKYEEVGFTVNEGLLRKVRLPGPAFAPAGGEDAEPGEEEPVSPLPKIG